MALPWIIKKTRRLSTARSLASWWTLFTANTPWLVPGRGKPLNKLYEHISVEPWWPGKSMLARAIWPRPSSNLDTMYWSLTWTMAGISPFLSTAKSSSSSNDDVDLTSFGWRLPAPSGHHCNCWTSTMMRSGKSSNVNGTLRSTAIWDSPQKSSGNNLLLRVMLGLSNRSEHTAGRPRPMKNWTTSGTRPTSTNVPMVPGFQMRTQCPLRSWSQLLWPSRMNGWLTHLQSSALDAWPTCPLKDPLQALAIVQKHLPPTSQPCALWLPGRSTASFSKSSMRQLLPLETTTNKIYNTNHLIFSNQMMRCKTNHHLNHHLTTHHPMIHNNNNLNQIYNTNNFLTYQHNQMTNNQQV